MSTPLADQIYKSLKEIGILMGFGTMSLLCIAGVVIYLSVYDGGPPFISNYVVVRNMNGINTRTFHAGEVMMVERENCANRASLVFINRQFESNDGVVFVLPNANNDYLMRLGCETTINSVTIPPHLKPGRYKYVVQVYYQNNFLSKGAVTMPAPEIDIVKE